MLPGGPDTPSHSPPGSGPSRDLAPRPLAGAAIEHAIAILLDTPGLNDGARIGLSFGLAHVADARKEYARAAVYLEQANALALDQNRKRNRRYDPQEHGLFVERLIEAFSPELFDRLAGAGDPTRQPVFVLGMPRSGTTLVEQILASHSQVHGAGELRLARETFELIQTVAGRDVALAQCLAALDSAGVSELARGIWTDCTQKLTSPVTGPGSSPTVSLTRCQTITCMQVCCRSSFRAPR